MSAALLTINTVILIIKELINIKLKKYYKDFFNNIFTKINKLIINFFKNFKK